jgi:hypothetical protein
MTTEMPALSVAVRARATVSAAPGEVADLRKQAAGAWGSAVGGSLAKHLDDQTAAILLAVRHAADAAGLTPADWAGWGAVAVPRAPGREVTGRQLDKFASEGPWGVSPHVIPHCSLHSAAGVLSLALGLSGPNLGVGGLPGREGEAVRVALPLVAGGLVPGMWLAWAGVCPADGTLRSAALAISAGGGPRLTLTHPGRGGPALTLESLSAHLAGGSWSLPGGGRLTLEGGV